MRLMKVSNGVTGSVELKSGPDKFLLFWGPLKWESIVVAFFVN